MTESGRYHRSAYAISLPVLSGRKLGAAYLGEGDVHGSAFALGADFMLTAGHVTTSVDRSGDDALLVGLPGPDGFFKAAYVSDIELLGADLGLLKVEFLVPESGGWFNQLRWTESVLDPFTRVRCVGYAYGIHRVEDRQSIVTRAFEGHIVSTLKEFKPIGSSERPFSVHELSFMTPRGLSGAPLLNASGKIAIHGVVIGNSESRMVVFRSEERVGDAAALSSIEQYEALTLGIAVTAEEVLRRESRLLGTTVREHLKAYDLLVQVARSDHSAFSARMPALAFRQIWWADRVTLVARTPNLSLNLTGRPTVVLRPELRPGRPAGQLQRYADMYHVLERAIPVPPDLDHLP